MKHIDTTPILDAADSLISESGARNVLDVARGLGDDKTSNLLVLGAVVEDDELETVIDAIVAALKVKSVTTEVQNAPNFH